MKQSPAKHEYSDADLLQLSAHGDEEAFVILYRRHHGPVFRYALHMSGSRETAEEVTQDVFLALLAGLRRYAHERGPLQPYLIGIARNQVRSYLAQSPPCALTSAERNLPLRGEDGHHLLEELSEEQELEAVRAAILKLPPAYREVVVLCDLENFEYAQAAAYLGCAVGTVRSRLHRARAILETKLRRRERCPT